MNPPTSDQAFFMLHTLGLPALRNEHRMTSAVIAAIPSDVRTIGRMPIRAARSSSRGISLALN
jgi:hypothetical protein